MFSGLQRPRVCEQGIDRLAVSGGNSGESGSWFLPAPGGPGPAGASAVSALLSRGSSPCLSPRFPHVMKTAGSGFWPTGTEGLEWITFLGKVNPQQHVYNTPWALKHPGVEVAPSFLSDTKNLELPQASVAGTRWSRGTSQRVGLHMPFTPMMEFHSCHSLTMKRTGWKLLLCRPCPADGC